MFGLPWFDLIVAPVWRIRDEGGTRDRLLQAASGLLREQGPGALTLEAVARRAHVSRGTLRYHFGGKQGLVEALVREQRGPTAALRALLKWKQGGRGRVSGPRRPTRSRVPRAAPAGDARRRSGDRWALP
ncbi:helix-turn-helix transcriptional regulator [Pyxidicoccus fallax]|uniref:Helix-turn-helix transcriptional regulator n=1 Tax=Pyxidicoccus fallax TaxID=394095 RepID=A0A848LFH1_9BACT|nr:helix-turn-helix transcriptional regulator [Pyxidicoccus fallax]NPC77321.1 helix-turn-helix transcriptional regulator [Pyxidicoccus fallax]